MKQELVLDSSGGGSMACRMDMAEFYVVFLDDFVDIDSSLEMTGASLEGLPRVSRVTAERTDLTEIEISFDFEHLEGLLMSAEELQESRALSLTDRGDTRLLEIRLNRENFSQLKGLVPLLDDPFLSIYGPEGSKGLSEDEYRETIRWTFEDSESYPGETLDAFDTSFLILDVTVPREVVSHRGGEKISSRTVEFRIPLIDVLLLNDEIYYSVEYR
jgi:hypothetical protein